MYLPGLSKITNEILTLTIMIISSLMPEIFLFNYSNNDKEEKIKFNFKKIILLCVSYLIMYFISISISVLSFSIIRNIEFKTDIWTTFFDFLQYIVLHYYVSIVIMPLFVRLFIHFFKKKTYNHIIRIILSSFLALILICVPFLTNFGYSNRVPIEKSILSEIRRIPFEFDSNLYDIDHLSKQINNKYSISEESEQNIEAKDNTESEKDTGSQEANVDFNNMSFESLLEYINNHMQDTTGNIALDIATQKFNENLYDSSNVENIADYFYYYAYIKKDDSFYKKAIEKYQLTNNKYMLGQAYRLWGYSADNTELLFEAIQFYKDAYNDYHTELYAWQIAYVYQNLYDDYKEDTLGEAITYFNLTIENGNEYKEDSVSRLLNDYILLYKINKCENNIDELNKSCSLAANNPLLQIIRINYNISNGNYLDSDIKIIDEILKQEDYCNFPKLYIMKAYLQYSLTNIKTELYRDSCEKALKVNMIKPEYFEAEDFINLARLYYMDGDYIKAYQLSEKQQDNKDVQEKAFLIMAESYLSAENLFPNLNAAKIYKMLNKISLSASDETSTSLRIKVVKGILEYRLGIDKTLSGLSESCRKLFGDSNVNSEYIVAFLKFCDGNFKECITICDKILSEFDTNDYSKNQVLFLKSDALVGQAKSLKSKDEKQKIYEEAEKVLLDVYNSVESDYITSLEKLHSLYKQMSNRESKLTDINEKLNVLQ